MTEKALADVTVLDFSHLLQGPFCTQLLADMGANVIKVERPGQGDLFRTMTFNNRWVGGSESPNFLAWNRNKRSIAVDLKSPDAKDDPLSYWRARRRGRAELPPGRARQTWLRLRGLQQRSTRASSIAQAQATAKAAPISRGPGKTC